MAKHLTDKQRAFIDHYFLCGLNATEAARRAGYRSTDDNVLASIGSENLRHPKIRAEIDKRLSEMSMSANEVLARYTDHARGSLADFLVLEDGADGKSTKFRIDLTKAVQAGKLHLIKELTVEEEERRIGPMTVTTRRTNIKLYDAQAALNALGKYHKLFDRALEVDWRKEMEQAGLNPDEVMETLTDEFTRHIAQGAKRALR
jgi:phage terminase small subunit